MISVMGTAKLRVNYCVKLNMTEGEFDALSETEQNDQIESAVDWFETCRNGEVEDIEVDDLQEVEKNDD